MVVQIQGAQTDPGQAALSQAGSRRERWARRWQAGGLRGLSGWARQWFYWNAGGRQLGARLEHMIGYDRFADTPVLTVTESIWQWSQTHPEVQQQSLFKDPVPEDFLLRIPGGVVTGQKGLLRLPDGRYALEWAGNPAVFSEELARHAAETPRPGIRLMGNFYSLLSPYPPDYDHWVFDGLLGLYGTLDQLPRDTQFIVPTSLSPLQRESLQAIGIGPSQLAFYTGDKAWELEALFYVARKKPGRPIRPEAVHWLQERLLQAFEIERSQPSGRIYLSPAAGRLSFANAAEMSATLHEHGFNTIHLEQLDLRAQLALFANAEAIAGGHDSGLTQVLVAPPGARVLELSRLSETSLYEPLCAAAGHAYWYLSGQDTPRPTPDGASQESLPIDQLKTVLGQMLAGHSNDRSATD